MTEVRLVGWNKGLQTVSLIKAICDHAGVSLSEAKFLVEELLDGRSVAVSFANAAKMNEFREVARRLGARCE